MKYSAKDLITFLSGRRHIRSVCNAASNVPIVLIKGNSAPQYKGTRWHYVTASGIKIKHPSAYSKSGWSNMYYQPSSLKVEVGEEWFSDNNFFDITKRVDGICYLLNSIGFHVVCNPIHRTYHVYHESNSVVYMDLPLSQFRKVANKLIKLKSFS